MLASRTSVLPAIGHEPNVPPKFIWIRSRKEALSGWGRNGATTARVFVKGALGSEAIGFPVSAAPFKEVVRWLKQDVLLSDKVLK